MIEYLVIGGLIILAVCGNQDAEAAELPEERERRRRRCLTGPYRVELSRDFENLASRLKPTDAHMGRLNKVSGEIFNYLKSVQEDAPAEYNLNMIDWIIAGSTGKGTAIWYKNPCDQRDIKPDIDLILFLQNSAPPFTRELNALAELLQGLDEVSDMKVRKYSIGFKIWIKTLGDVRVDLLPAQAETTEAIRGLDERQRQAVAETSQVSRVENKLRSSAFSRKTVEIIRSHVEDSYVQSVVLIAKYWNSLIDMDKFGYVPARSCIIELLAIHAQKVVVQRDGPRDLVSGFRRFLEIVSRFRKLDITLGNEELPDVTITYQKPMIRDPGNSYNNLTEGIPQEVMLIWEEQAKKTLVILEEYRNNNMYVENAIDEIFFEKS